MQYLEERQLKLGINLSGADISVIRFGETMSVLPVTAALS